MSTIAVGNIASDLELLLMPRIEPGRSDWCFREPDRLVGFDLDGDTAWGLCLIHDTVLSPAAAATVNGGPVCYRIDADTEVGPKLMWWVGHCPPNEGY